jgi:restriction system protein
VKYLNIYIEFLDGILMKQGIFIPEWMVLSISFISLILLLFVVYYIYKKTQKRWRIKISYKVLKKIKSFSGNGITPRTLAYLRKIDPFVFEEVILSAIKIQKLKIKRNSRYTYDGGIDGQFWSNRKHYLIQAKRYKGYITKSHVVEFKRLCSKNRSLGIFVHTGKIGKQTKLEFTKEMKSISDENLVSFLRNELNIKSIL